MQARDLVQRYMDIMFANGELDDLYHIFSSDLVFKGPFYEFTSADEYIQALKSGPPRDFSYVPVRSYEDESSVCLVYEFNKPGVSTIMSQVFETRDGKISRITLIFDSGMFKPTTAED